MISPFIKFHQNQAVKFKTGTLCVCLHNCSLLQRLNLDSSMFNLHKSGRKHRTPYVVINVRNYSKTSSLYTEELINNVKI